MVRNGRHSQRSTRTAGSAVPLRQSPESKCPAHAHQIPSPWPRCPDKIRHRTQRPARRRSAQRPAPRRFPSAEEQSRPIHAIAAAQRPLLRRLPALWTCAPVAAVDSHIRCAPRQTSARAGKPAVAHLVSAPSDSFVQGRAARFECSGRCPLSAIIARSKRQSVPKRRQVA